MNWLFFQYSRTTVLLFCSASSTPHDFFFHGSWINLRRRAVVTRVRPPWAQRPGAGLTCLSSCLICLQNGLFGEALNVASSDLYASHIQPNKSLENFPNVYWRKNHISALFMLQSPPEDIISSLIFSETLWVTIYYRFQLARSSKRQSMNYLCHYFCCW